MVLKRAAIYYELALRANVVVTRGICFIKLLWQGDGLACIGGAHLILDSSQALQYVTLCDAKYDRSMTTIHWYENSSSLLLRNYYHLDAHFSNNGISGLAYGLPHPHRVTRWVRLVSSSTSACGICICPILLGVVVHTINTIYFGCLFK